MRISRVLLMSLVLTLAVAASVTATTAAPSSFTVQFVDTYGTPYSDCDVAVYDEEGNLMQKLPASGGTVYSIVAEKGTKLRFELFEPGTGSVRTEAYIPNIFMQPLDIAVQTASDPLAAPPNDLCEDAVDILTGSVTAGTTVEATVDAPPAPDCIGFPSGSSTITSPGVWYTFEGTGTLVTADLCNGNTGYDSKLGAFCLDCEDLTCVDGNDDSCGLQSAMTFCTQLGRTYRVLVHGFGGQTGSFDLTLTDTGAPCEAAVDCSPPVPVGACCDCAAPPFNCQVVTEAECLAQGGLYQGDDTSCITSDGMPTGYGAGNPALPIPDNDPGGVSHTINVPDLFNLADVNVDVIVEHTFIGDLVISLSHAGETVVLWDRACSFENDLDATFDDQGLPLVCAEPTTGAITPLSADGQMLSAFNNLESAGDWTLTVSDNAGLDTGTLIDWAITLESGAATCADQNNADCFLCEPSGECPDGDKVTLCHYPPGNPANAHTIEVGAPALPWHLAHGDLLGPCGDEENAGMVETETGGFQTGVVDMDADGGSVDDKASPDSDVSEPEELSPKSRRATRHDSRHSIRN